MRSRRDNRVSTRGRDSSQQAEDVTEVALTNLTTLKFMLSSCSVRISVQLMELFHACSSKDGITQNVEAANAIMYGLGVRASNVWGVVPSRSAHRRDKLQWKSIAERLSIELAEYKSKEAQSKGRVIMIPMVQMFHIHHHRATLLPMNLVILRVGLQVYLKSISKYEYLVRKYGLFVTVQDAIGAPVAWPCSLISVVREDD
ncbi:hypothetical protein Tco_1362812 [Tanacetum coccineum]